MSDQKLKGIIFDADGTLLDSLHIWRDAAERFLNTLGIQAEKNLGRKLFNYSIAQGAEYLVNTYNLHMAQSEAADGVLGQVEGFYLNEAKAKPGAAEMLKKLSEKHIPMVIATSSDREHIKGAMVRLGFDQYFSEIFTCADIGAGKDKPLIYFKAAEFMGFSHKEVLVVEDALYALKTAADAGFFTAGVEDSFSEADLDAIRSLAHIYVKSWEDEDAASAITELF